MPTVPQITKRVVDSQQPSDCTYDVYDEKLPGYHLRVHPSGKKAFYVYYRFDGTQRRKKISDFGIMTPDEARAEARRILSAVALGADPAAVSKPSAPATSVEELAERYFREHVKKENKKSSASCVRSNLDCHIIPALGAKKVDQVTFEDVDGLHQMMEARPYAANRVVSNLSTMFRLAEKWGLRPRGSNPCIGVEKYREKGRERYLDGEELIRFADALAEGERQHGTHHQTGCFALHLLLLTGCRKQEILKLQWRQYDQGGKRLILYDSKTGEGIVHLNQAAIDILGMIDHKSTWVFPGGKEGHPLCDLKSIWDRILKNASLSGVRIHDLRHTFGTLARSAGAEIHDIASLLRHKDIRTTMRYAHGEGDAIRAASEKTSSLLHRRMTRS